MYTMHRAVTAAAASHADPNAHTPSVAVATTPRLNQTRASLFESAALGIVDGSTKVSISETPAEPEVEDYPSAALGIGDGLKVDIAGPHLLQTRHGNEPQDKRYLVRKRSRTTHDRGWKCGLVCSSTKISNIHCLR